MKREYNGVICPKCGNSNTKIYETRWRRKGTEFIRRRKCECGHRWRTLELEYYEVINLLKGMEEEDYE